MDKTAGQGRDSKKNLALPTPQPKFIFTAQNQGQIFTGW
jgi:hypothetical protein